MKMLTSFASRPACWFGLLSLPWVILGGVTLAVGGALYAYDLIKEWTVLSTMAFLLLFLGNNLLAMGLMGELLVKTGDHSSRGSSRLTISMLEVK